MILGIDHVQLAMPHGGEDQARRFYRGVLGMIEVPKPAQLAINGGVWFAAGTARIHLGVEDGHRPSRKAHPALLVSDLALLARRLELSGSTFTPGKPLPGVIRGDIIDPFGNRIELMERVGAPALAGAEGAGEGEGRR